MNNQECTSVAGTKGGSDSEDNLTRGNGNPNVKPWPDNQDWMHPAPYSISLSGE